MWAQRAAAAAEVLEVLLAVAMAALHLHAPPSLQLMQQQAAAAALLLKRTAAIPVGTTVASARVAERATAGSNSDWLPWCAASSL